MNEAAAALEQAATDLQAASNALDAARGAFEREPSAATEAAVEAAERERRSAERFHEARTRGLDAWKVAERVRAKAEAITRRDELRESRAGVFAAVRARMVELGSLYELLNALIEAIDAEIARDFAICGEHQALATIAGAHDVLQPLDPEIVRLAIGLDLAELWNDEPEDRPGLDFGEAVRAAERLKKSDPAVAFHRRLAIVQMEAEHALRSAPAHRWLATVADSGWDDHSPAAGRVNRAAALLAQLKETPP